METLAILVIFFSHTGENYSVGHIEKGNTHIIAEMIAAETGAETFEIVPVNDYPESYNECVDLAKKELATKARPEIKGDIAVEDYDVIFIGYPNWWGDLPMPVYTFLEKHSWAGKTVIPFCTHEGSGLGRTPGRLKEACKDATMLDGLAIYGSTAQNSREEAESMVKNWIKKLF